MEYLNIDIKDNSEFIEYLRKKICSTYCIPEKYLFPDESNDTSFNLRYQEHFIEHYFKRV